MRSDLRLSPGVAQCVHVWPGRWEGNAEWAVAWNVKKISRRTEWSVVAKLAATPSGENLVLVRTKKAAGMTDSYKLR